MTKHFTITRLIIVVLCLFAPILLFTVTYAIPQPDSDPSIYDTHVNRNLITAGDALIYGQYILPYEDEPTTPASDAFIIRLIDTDNVTELGAVTPHPYFDNGYNHGAFGLYFESDLTWNTSYIIRISENPSQFDVPVSFDYVMPLTSYTSETTQDNNRLELAINIITIAQSLETHHPDYDLLEASASGTVLSAPQGESYFRAIIPGIQVMAPSIFLVQVLPLDMSSENWTTEQFEEYEERFEGTWVGSSENATAEQFGLTPQTIMGALVVLPCAVGAIFISARKFKRVEPGFIVTAVLLIMAVIMGWLPKAIFAAAFQAMGIYIAYLWFYSRG